MHRLQRQSHTAATCGEGWSLAQPGSSQIACWQCADCMRCCAGRPPCTPISTHVQMPHHTHLLAHVVLTLRCMRGCRLRARLPWPLQPVHVLRPLPQEQLVPRRPRRLSTAHALRPLPHDRHHARAKRQRLHHAAWLRLQRRQQHRSSVQPGHLQQRQQPAAMHALSCGPHDAGGLRQDHPGVHGAARLLLPGAMGRVHACLYRHAQAATAKVPQYACAPRWPALVLHECLTPCVSRICPALPAHVHVHRTCKRGPVLKARTRAARTGRPPAQPAHTASQRRGPPPPRPPPARWPRLATSRSCWTARWLAYSPAPRAATAPTACSASRVPMASRQRPRPAPRPRTASRRPAMASMPTAQRTPAAASARPIWAATRCCSAPWARSRCARCRVCVVRRRAGWRRVLSCLHTRNHPPRGVHTRGVAHPACALQNGWSLEPCQSCGMGLLTDTSNTEGLALSSDQCYLAPGFGSVADATQQQLVASKCDNGACWCGSRRLHRAQSLWIHAAHPHACPAPILLAGTYGSSEKTYGLVARPCSVRRCRRGQPACVCCAPGAMSSWAHAAANPPTSSMYMCACSHAAAALPSVHNHTRRAPAGGADQGGQFHHPRLLPNTSWCAVLAVHACASVC
jgi:hypothetical protein